MQILIWSIIPNQAFAHSLPDNQAQIFVNNHKVIIRFKAAREIYELASKNSGDINKSENRAKLNSYLLKHIHVNDSLKSHWLITLGKAYIHIGNNNHIGNFEELVFEINLIPSQKLSCRNFNLFCDLIIHQVQNQSILCSIHQDFQTGVFTSNPTEIGIINVGIDGKIAPLRVKLLQVNAMKGFTKMLNLGMQHIAEGTDHLLFLIVLLLPMPLLAKNNRWASTKKTSTSILNIVKVISAFTIGHSITLALGTMSIIILPSYWIEIIIGITILISSIHAIKPLFEGKEIFIALGFGFIHGLAFSNTLQDLHLDIKLLFLSILGFNLGIEIQQLLVVLVAIPIIIFGSKSTKYQYFRIAIALLAIVAALAWIVERIYLKPNIVSEIISKYLTLPTLLFY